METIMRGTYKPAEDMKMKYPRYTLFSDVRTNPNSTVEETVYGIIRQYSEDTIQISIFDSLQTAYHVYRLFRGEDN